MEHVGRLEGPGKSDTSRVDNRIPTTVVRSSPLRSSEPDDICSALATERYCTHWWTTMYIQ
jgi:hypothetical protein